MRTRKPLTFETIPAWAIDPSTRDRHTVAAAFTLAELNDRWVRLTADAQRAVFGAVLFGKCEVRITGKGIETVRTVCFGTDFSFVAIRWESIERCMATGEKPIF